MKPGDLVMLDHQRNAHHFALVLAYNPNANWVHVQWAADGEKEWLIGEAIAAVPKEYYQFGCPKRSR